MAQSNHERVGKALELLNQGLRPFIERELQAVHGAGWQEAGHAGLRESRTAARGKGNATHWDTQTLLGVMWKQWNRDLPFRIDDQCFHEEPFFPPSTRACSGGHGSGATPLHSDVRLANMAFLAERLLKSR